MRCWLFLIFMVILFWYLQNESVETFKNHQSRNNSKNNRKSNSKSNSKSKKNSRNNHKQKNGSNNKSDTKEKDNRVAENFLGWLSHFPISSQKPDKNDSWEKLNKNNQKLLKMFRKKKPANLTSSYEKFKVIKAGFKNMLGMK